MVRSLPALFIIIPLPQSMDTLDNEELRELLDDRDTDSDELAEAFHELLSKQSKTRLPAFLKEFLTHWNNQIRELAFDQLASLPKEKAIPLIKQGLIHWDRSLREKCAYLLAQMSGADAVNDIISANLTIYYTLALMKYCEGPQAVTYLLKHLGQRQDWDDVAKPILGSYADPQCMLMLWGNDGQLTPVRKAGINKISETEISRFIEQLPAEKSQSLLASIENWRYLKTRGLLDYSKPKASKTTKKAAAKPQKKIQDPEQLAKLHEIRSQEFETLSGILELDTMFLGQFISGWNLVDKRYRQAKIRKKSGGFRQLAVPDDYLKSVQRSILDKLLVDAPLHDSCHGFRGSRSVATNATPHQKTELVINIDLKDFFTTVTANRVYGIFKQLGHGNFASSLLTQLTIYKGALPQGAPTSPALANLAASRMDSRLNGLAEKIGASYTRYADDLTFSGPESMLSSLPMVRKIITEESFQIAEHKFHIARPKDRQEVTGLTVNEKLAIPRSVRKQIRAVAHHISNGKKAVWRGKTVDKASLIGLAAYVRPFHSELAEQCTAAANSMKKKKR